MTIITSVKERGTQDMLEKSALYIVATPIGNLNDISLRALNILKAVDVVAVENIQNSKHLLAAHGISTQLMSLHQHNEISATNKILTLLNEGQSVALITDAGTPAISDPGALLVQQVRAKGYPVVPIPGANAAICALSAAGVMHPHFFFFGFLSAKPVARKRELLQFKSQEYPIIFYEAPHRIIECVEDMIEIIGADRTLIVARELTKLFETIHIGSLIETLDWLKSDTRGAMQAAAGIAIEPPPGFCAAKCFAVRIAGRIEGAAVLPDEADYPADKLEIVAPVAVRQELHLNDGDRVTLQLQIE